MTARNGETEFPQSCAPQWRILTYELRGADYELEIPFGPVAKTVCAQCRNPPTAEGNDTAAVG